MALWHLFLLAVVQGITEFLPVSSSAHLILFPHALGVADQGLVIDLAVHVGSLLAVALVFHKEVFLLSKTFFIYGKASKENRSLLHNVLIAIIPVIISGAIFHFFFPSGLRVVWLIATTSIVFGIFLFFADKIGSEDIDCKNLSLKKSVCIGMAHIFALIPGVSRSGVTMTAARAVGMSRIEAARFSLLIGMPVIAGAGAVGFYDLINSGSIKLGIDALIAVIFSFIAAWVSIVLMLKWLTRFSFTVFAVYRILLGFVILLYFF